MGVKNPFNTTRGNGTVWASERKNIDCQRLFCSYRLAQIFMYGFYWSRYFLCQNVEILAGMFYTLSCNKRQRAGVESLSLTHISLVFAVSGEVPQQTRERTELGICGASQKVKNHRQHPLLLQRHTTQHRGPLTDNTGKQERQRTISHSVSQIKH